MLPNLPEKFRVTLGKFATTKDDGPNGAFIIPARSQKVKGQCLLIMINTSPMGWEHASVRMYNSKASQVMTICPSWNDMCDVKQLFWGQTETVIQIHPDESLYQNKNGNILHLWSCKITGPFPEFPMPPAFMANLLGFELGERGKVQDKLAKEFMLRLTEPATP